MYHIINMAQTINELICVIIGEAYDFKYEFLEERTEDEKDEYEEELKNELFNSGEYHHDADDINMDKYMKIVKPLYHYYKDEFDMGENVIDALDDKQKLFNLYALMVFGDMIEEVVSDKTEEEDEEDEDEDEERRSGWAREDNDDVWG